MGRGHPEEFKEVLAAVIGSECFDILPGRGRVVGTAQMVEIALMNLVDLVIGHIAHLLPD